MYGPADDWTRVTASTHPQVHAAFDLISGANHVAYNVPNEYAYGLAPTENALGQLNNDERVKLCQGDCDLLVLSLDILAALDTLAAFAHNWPALIVKRHRIGGRRDYR